jgi:hypothetical protein
MKTVLRPCTFLLLLFLISAIPLFHCTTTNPITSSGGPVLSIRLSLDTKGARKADYIGSPINAIVEFADTVVCTFDSKQPEHIQLFLGSGRFRIPDEAISGKRVNRVVIPLYWTRKPTNIDSHSVRFDTVFVQVGQVRSNSGRVNVLNIAPAVDSLVVGDSAIAVFTDVFGPNLYRFDTDTMWKVPLRIVSHDPDGDLIQTQWRALINQAMLFQLADDKKVYYQTPVFNFLDTIGVVVSDGKLGNVQLNLILSRTGGLDILKIDSVRVGVVTLADTTPFVSYAGSRLDTVAVKVYFTNRSGYAVTAVWQAPKGAVGASAGAVSPLQNVYVSKDSSTSQVLTKDTIKVIDTLTVSLVAQGSDTVRKKIILKQVPSNRRPIIDSIAVDRRVVVSNIHHPKAGDTVMVVVRAHDPDGVKDVTTVSWQGGRGVVVRSSKDTAWYPVPDSGRDSLVITVLDTMKFKANATLSFLVNRSPRIDSIAVGDSLFRATAATSEFFGYPDSANDTVAVRLYARDQDAGDSLAVQWKVKGGKQTQKTFSTMAFSYIAADKTYRDTAACFINDRYGLTDTAFIYFSIVK